MKSSKKSETTQDPKANNLIPRSESRMSLGRRNKDCRSYFNSLFHKRCRSSKMNCFDHRIHQLETEKVQEPFFVKNLRSLSSSK